MGTLSSAEMIANYFADISEYRLKKTSKKEENSL
jgi:hypothetical protein